MVQKVIRILMKLKQTVIASSTLLCIKGDSYVYVTFQKTIFYPLLYRVCPRMFVFSVFHDETAHCLMSEVLEIKAIKS